MGQRKIGIVLSYLAQCINILSGLIYTPIMLRLLGQSEYGLYQLVYSVVSYMSLLSLGFSGAYMRFYSRFKAKNDDEGVAKLNGMFMTIFLCISGVCVVCGIVMVSNIRLIFGTGITDTEYPTARVLMALMVLNLALTFPNSVFDSITSSHERFFFQKLLIVLQNLLNPFITFPLLLMGYGSVAMVTVTTVLTLSKLLLNIGYCLGKLRVRFRFKGFDFKLLKEMWIFTFFIFINLIVDQINWNIDKFLLGRIIGTTAVAIYGVSAQLNSLYIHFSTAVSNVFAPKVNRIVAETNDNHELTLLLTRVGRIQFIILFLVLSGFVFFGRPFVILWAGAEYEVAYNIGLLLMVPVTIPLVQNLGIEIQRAKNMHKARSVAYLIIAISNIFVSIPCIMKWGAQGAAIGTALTLLIGNGFFMNWYYHKRIGLDILYFWKQILKFIPSLIIPCIVGIIMMYFIEIKGVMVLIACAVVYSIIYMLSMWFVGMDATEKQGIKNTMNFIKKKRQN